MRLGFISTRLNGTDGVSLEVEKWATVLKQLGHDVYFCAGELGGYAAGGTLIPQLHFEQPSIANINHRAFGPQKHQTDANKLLAEIQKMAAAMRVPLQAFVRTNRLETLIVENALAIPMNLPLGLALAQLVADLQIRTIAHNHDYFWERPRYQTNPILDFLDTYFPPDLPTIQHASINSIAQQRLKARRGINSTVVPNVHNFSTPPPPIDDYSRDFRKAIGLSSNDLFILQPTRVIQRKGIEMAIELVSRLNLAHKQLFITHQAGDEGLEYWHWLEREAKMMSVDLRLVDHLIGTTRKKEKGQKIYSLWDAYPHANLVTYPSIYEGFGNALLEAIYFKRPIVINRYPVYNADIGPLGFEFVELDGFVDAHAVEKTKELLENQEQIRAMAEHNYALAQHHFSLERLAQKLQQLLA